MYKNTKKYYGLSDYHMHTQASPDSEEKIDNICLKAIDLGLFEIAITDHYDCIYEKCKDVLKESMSLIDIAKLKYSSKIKIKKGIEIGEANQFPDIASYALKYCEYDFILASIHNIKNHIDFYWMKNEPNKEELINLYFNELIEICQNCDFDVLAHLTYPLRYEAFWGGIDLSLFEKQITQIFQLLINSGKGLEINTAAVRTDHYRELAPTVELIKYYKSLGGEIITIGSDAHKSEDIAADFDIAVNAAKEAGFTKYAIYTSRKPEFINL